MAKPIFSLPNKSISPIQTVLLSVWIIAHFVGFAAAGLFVSALMGLGFDEMHTSGTAMDSIPGLTREIVMKNILYATLSWCWIAPVAAATVYFISDVFWEHLGKTGKRSALFLSVTCALVLLAAILGAGVRCFLRFP